MSTTFSNLMQFALDLQSSSSGLSKEQLMDRYNERTGGETISVRTCDRWLSHLMDLGLEVEYTDRDGEHYNKKYYKLKHLPTKGLDLTDDERSALERYLANPNIDANTDKFIRRGISKILADREPLTKTILHKTQELIDQTAHTGSVQPKMKIDETQIAIIEKAIQYQQIISFKYKTQTSKRGTQTKTLPLGLLFGRFGYLVCLGMSEKPIIYRLDLLQDVKETDKVGVRPLTFNFKKWCAESFGIFHGDKMINVVIEFSPKVSERASKITFHPSQKMKFWKDKTLRLSLKCKGWREIIYEVLHPDYLGEVKIIEPQELKDEFKNYIKKCESVVS